MREIVEGGRLKGWKPAKRLKECRFQREEYYLGVMMMTAAVMAAIKLVSLANLNVKR